MYNTNKRKVLIKIGTIVIKGQSRDYFHMRSMLNGAGAKLTLNRMVGVSNCRAEQKGTAGEEAAGAKSGRWKQRACGRERE